MGHARVLAGIKDSRDQRTVRDRIVKNGLTVRQAETMARTLLSPRTARSQDPDGDYLLSLADTLKQALGTKVEIRRRGRRGRITIHFYSDDELERLLDRLG